jgi:hypothetical protein
MIHEQLGRANRSLCGLISIDVEDRDTFAQLGEEVVHRERGVGLTPGRLPGKAPKVRRSRARGARRPRTRGFPWGEGQPLAFMLKCDG